MSKTTTLILLTLGSLFFTGCATVPLPDIDWALFLETISEYQTPLLWTGASITYLILVSKIALNWTRQNETSFLQAKREQKKEWLKPRGWEWFVNGDSPFDTGTAPTSIPPLSLQTNLAIALFSGWMSIIISSVKLLVSTSQHTGTLVLGPVGHIIGRALVRMFNIWATTINRLAPPKLESVEVEDDLPIKDDLPRGGPCL